MSPDAFLGPLFDREVMRGWPLVSIEKARSILGWQPVPLDEWMLETARWWAGSEAASLPLPPGLPAHLISLFRRQGLPSFPAANPAFKEQPFGIRHQKQSPSSARR